MRSPVFSPEVGRPAQGAPPPWSPCPPGTARSARAALTGRSKVVANGAASRVCQCGNCRSSSGAMGGDLFALWDHLRRSIEIFKGGKDAIKLGGLKMLLNLQS